jgi:hypothetical protein
VQKTCLLSLNVSSNNNQEMQKNEIIMDYRIKGGGVRGDVVG